MFECRLVPLVLRIGEDHIADGLERTLVHLWNFELVLETFTQHIFFVEDYQLVESFPGTCGHIEVPTLHSSISAWKPTDK